MKFHINDNFEVKPCGASDDVRCPFYGHHEGSNHYTNESDALKAAEKILAAQHPFENRRKAATAKFLNHSSKIKKLLQDYADMKPKNFPEVSNNSEMIEKWFGGDEGSYETFVHFLSSDELKNSSKKTVAAFVKSGMKLSKEVSVKDIPIEKSDPYEFDASEITVIDDGPDKVDWDDLMNGKIKAFQF